MNSSKGFQFQPHHSGSPLLITAGGAIVVLAAWAMLADDMGSAGVAIASIFLVLGCVFVRALTGVFRPLSIIAILTYCQAILFIARPLYVVTFQDSINIFTDAAYDIGFVWAELYCGLGYLILCIAYGLSAGNLKSSTSELRPVNVPSEESWSRLRKPLYLIAAIGLSLYIGYIFQTGWSSYWSGTLTGRSEEQRSALSAASGYLYSGLQFATGTGLFLFLVATVKGHKPSQIGAMLFLAVTVFPQIASGSRAVFIPIIIAALAIIARSNPGVLKLKSVAIWLPTIGFLGFIAPRIWRDNLASGVSIFDSLLEAARPENIFGGFLGGLDTAMIDAFSVQLQGHFAGTLPYLYGSSYLAALGSPIPRGLWPGKPESIDQILNEQLFPATDARGIGFAFSAYSEPTANFGFAGVVVMMLIFGFVLGRVARATETSTLVLNTFFYAMTAGYIFPLMRGSFTFNIQRLLIPLIPVLIALLVERITRPAPARSRSRRHGPSASRFHPQEVSQPATRMKDRQ